MLNVKILNTQPALNNFFYDSAVQYAPGESVAINFQFFTPDNGCRFVPGTGATATCAFQVNDGTTLTVNASMLFPADDRSMWTVSLTAMQSETIVGVNMLVTLDVLGDGTVIQQAPALNVLSPILTDGDC